MAWVATEPFTLTSGQSLNGTGGGSGWSTSWASTPAGAFIGDTSFFSEGTSSVKNSTVDADSVRTLSTGVTSGLVAIDMARSVTSNNAAYCHFRDGTTIKFTALMNPDGHIYVGAGATGTDTDLGTYSANTWYSITMEIDQANSRIRARLDNNDWSSYFSVTFTSISSMRLNTSNSAGTFVNYYDNIRPGSNPPTSAAARDARNLTLLGVS